MPVRRGGGALSAVLSTVMVTVTAEQGVTLMVAAPALVSSIHMRDGKNDCSGQCAMCNMRGTSCNVQSAMSNRVVFECVVIFVK